MEISKGRRKLVKKRIRESKRKRSQYYSFICRGRDLDYKVPIRTNSCVTPAVDAFLAASQQEVH